MILKASAANGALSSGGRSTVSPSSPDFVGTMPVSGGTSSGDGR